MGEWNFRLRTLFLEDEGEMKKRSWINALNLEKF